MCVFPDIEQNIAFVRVCETRQKTRRSKERNDERRFFIWKEECRELYIKVCEWKEEGVGSAHVQSLEKHTVLCSTGCTPLMIRIKYILYVYIYVRMSSKVNDLSFISLNDI